MPRNPATEEHKEEIRQSLRRAAARVYREHGISGVTARAVAVAAGVSVGTIYAHFGDLKSLMQSLWIEPVERFNNQFREVSARHADPVERLKALMELYVSIAAKHPELYRNAFMFVRAEALTASEKDAAGISAFPALLRTALQDGQAAGLVREGSPDRLADLIWAGLHGSIALPINFDRIEFGDAQSLSADMVALLVAQIKR